MNKASIETRVLFSAMLLHYAERNLRALKAKPCTERSRGTIYCAPIEACDIHRPGADLCENCSERVANLSKYKTALRKRSAAKQKLLRWCAKVPFNSDPAKEPTNGPE